MSSKYTDFLRQEEIAKKHEALKRKNTSLLIIRIRFPKI